MVVCSLNRKSLAMVAFEAAVEVLGGFMSSCRTSFYSRATARVSKTVPWPVLL